AVVAVSIPLIGDAPSSGTGMQTWSFRSRGLPPEIFTPEQPGSVIYRLLNGGRWVGTWIGGIRVRIAGNLRPFAQPVLLDFGGYRIGDQGWIEIDAGSAIWGCLLRGTGRGATAVFALQSGGQPVLANVSRHRVYIPDTGP